MSEPLNSQQGSDGHKSSTNQVLLWARCHPGMLVVGSLAVAALLTRKTAEPEAEALPLPQTEADFVDGETPLFI